ncbi:MAG: efflux RND transporter permease subunit [Anaerovoracaceae bacterium]
MLDKISHILTRKPKLILTISLLMLIPSIIGYLSTRVNYDILSYLPKDLETTKGEALLEEPFKMAATSMLVVEDMPNVYTEDLVRDIKNVTGVSSVTWLSDMVGPQFPVEMLPKELTSHLYSENSTLIVIQYSRAASSQVTMDAIDNIRSLCNKHCFLSGFSVLMRDIRGYMDAELPLYIMLAVLLSMGAMLLTLESSVLPFAFLGNIGLAVAYNMGSNLFLGEISYVTQALAAVLQLAVTMDYSIFLYHRYSEERCNYDDPRDAMSVAVKAAFGSLSGSSLTTIAGFLALCFMHFSLGLNIGLVMAKGVILGVLTVIIVLPSILLLLDKHIQKHTHRSLIPDTSKLTAFIMKHKTLTLVIFALLIIPAYYGQAHADTYYKISDSLPRETPSTIASEKLSSNFNIASMHVAIVDADLPSTAMNNIEAEIKEVDGISSVISYNSILGAGIPDFFIPEDIHNMLKQDGKQLIMINTEYETASRQIADQVKTLNKILKKYDSSAMLTGESAMTEDLISTTSTDFKVTNYITLAAVFFIILFVLRSLSIPIALIIPIEISIYINQSFVYFLGGKMFFITPALISAIQMGSTIDYAILMTTRFKEEIQNGLDRKAAITVAATESDKSIFTSALVLFTSMLGVMLVSHIDLISSICIMLARGAIISMLICVVVLPVILYEFEPVFARTSLKWRSNSD